MILQLTKDNFTEVVNTHPLIIVDFWAKWCGPCRDFKKIIERVALQYSDIVFASVDVEKEEELSKDFNIISVPAIMILRNQVVVFAETGLLSANVLIELINKAQQLNIAAK